MPHCTALHDDLRVRSSCIPPAVTIRGLRWCRNRKHQADAIAMLGAAHEIGRRQLHSPNVLPHQPFVPRASPDFSPSSLRTTTIGDATSRPREAAWARSTIGSQSAKKHGCVIAPRDGRLGSRGRPRVDPERATSPIVRAQDCAAGRHRPNSGRNSQTVRLTDIVFILSDSRTV